MHKANILITASASNEGANAPITFPANLPIVICIGAADGKGNHSEFTSYKSGVEKYSILGVAVSGATEHANPIISKTERILKIELRTLALEHSTRKLLLFLL